MVAIEEIIIVWAWNCTEKWEIFYCIFWLWNTRKVYITKNDWTVD